MVESIDVVVAGAGPAGLRAAQVLAEAGREVLVVERQARVGPKTCAGGLSPKTVRELQPLGLPPGLGRTSLPTVSICGGAALPVDPGYGLVRTVSRAALGALQSRWAREAGAEILTGTDVREIDFAAHRLLLRDRPVRYRHLIGADGSTSRIRRALGLPAARAYFAGEFNVPGQPGPSLLVAYDSERLSSGYFWIFPHSDYTSFGAGAPVSQVRPAAVRRYLEERLAGLGVPVSSAPFEAATIEVQFVGFHFPNDVHLTGDAAGLASPLTGEGIYAALVSGEEVARQILEPRFPARKTAAWLRLKRVHDRLARAWLSKPVRDLSLRLLAAAARSPRLRTRATAFFLGG